MPFVDAPVLGTKQPAEQGKLIVLASGPEDVRERAATAVRRDRREDAVGSARPARAAALKLVLNTWLLALVEGLAETIALAEGARRRPADVPRARSTAARSARRTRRSRAS